MFKMNMSNRREELCGYYEIQRGTTVFFTEPYDARTALMEGQKALCAMADIGEWHVKNVCDKKDIYSNTVESSGKRISANKRKRKSEEWEEVADEEEDISELEVPMMKHAIRNKHEKMNIPRKLGLAIDAEFLRIAQVKIKEKRKK